MKMNVHDYLKRIGYEGEVRLDYATLAKLQLRHVHTVPYENLDIINKKSISLHIPDIYEKIVVNKRGGYCFELNGLFGWLLSEIGFDVTHFMGRFLKETPGIPTRGHRVLRIRLDGTEYLCDVGVGGPVPFIPIQLIVGQENKMRNENYRLKKDSFLGWVLEEMHNEKWRNLYSFTEEKQLDIDFIMPSFYYEHSETSMFNKTAMVAIRTQNGRYSLDDMEFKAFTNDGVITKVPASNDEYDRLLKEYFGIIVKV